MEFYQSFVVCVSTEELKLMRILTTSATTVVVMVIVRVVVGGSVV